MNTVRARDQWAGAVMAGYGAATTREPLPPHWGDTLAMLPEEADELAFSINEAKMTANLFR